MDNVIVEKICNAFYPEAKRGLLGFGLGGLLLAALRNQSGLWVGGNFKANHEWLYFEPNLLNIHVQHGVPPIQIHVSEVRNIRRESGWGTDIVIIDHARGEFKFRCYGADKIVSTLMSYYFRPAY